MTHDHLSGVVLNALPHPVFTILKSGLFGYANAACENFFQSSFAMLAKRDFSWFIRASSPLHTLVEQVRRDGAPVNEYRVDVSSPRLDGERFVDAYVAPINDGTNSVLVMLQVRSMADALDKQLTHRGAARSVTGLAAMLAHEIKNPLSGIRGAAQLLENSERPEDMALTQLITDETDRIVRLVDRMEVFSDERPIERDPLNIYSVLDHVKALATSGFGKDVRFVEKYDPSLPPVFGNRDQLIQVFLNLIKNSCEELNRVKNPTITLRAAYRAGMYITAQGGNGRVSLPISLSVEDNGPGIPDDMQAYLFDPFVSSKPNGSGLGLALVAKIIGDHGGIISCDSQSGQTRFTILLSAAQGFDRVSGDSEESDHG